MSPRRRAVGREAANAPAVAAPQRAAAQVHSLPMSAGAVLDPQAFLAMLGREMRRVERSQSPLSLVLYRFDGDASQRSAASDRLLDVLVANTRETDVIGCLDDEIAVLCPDTDDRGVRDFIEKVKAQSAGIGVPAPTPATYPNALFDHLATGAPSRGTLVPFVSSEHDRPYALKRALDIAGALIAIALFSPVMLAVALLIKLGSRGPIVFMQQRLGRGGVPFTFYKFRSMRTDADDSIHRQYVARLISGPEAEAADNATASAPFKLVADPRITPIGRFIRRTSLDELPQLFNVLKGDMSLVGPRPPLPYEVASYRPWHLRRILAGQPGITGLWQVEGRSRVPFNDMVRMDLRYRRECSLWLDLKILCKTVLVVLRCKGAV